MLWLRRSLCTHYIGCLKIASIPSQLSDMTVRTSKPKMTDARAALIQVLERYGLLGYRMSRIEIPKLAYFLKAAGEPALQDLKYGRFHYGPYSTAHCDRYHGYRFCPKAVECSHC